MMEQMPETAGLEEAIKENKKLGVKPVYEQTPVEEQYLGADQFSFNPELIQILKKGYKR